MKENGIPKKILDVKVEGGKTSKRKTKIEMGARDYERCHIEGIQEGCQKEMWTDRKRRRSSVAVIHTHAGGNVKKKKHKNMQDKEGLGHII